MRGIHARSDRVAQKRRIVLRACKILSSIFAAATGTFPNRRHILIAESGRNDSPYRIPCPTGYGKTEGNRVKAVKRKDNNMGCFCNLFDNNEWIWILILLCILFCCCGH